MFGRPPDPAGRRRQPLRVPAPAGVATAPHAQSVSRTNAFQAVSVIACQQACAAASKAQGQRFLARQAPRLPLIDCSRPGDCRCRFEKFADRRRGPQRSPYTSMDSPSFGGVEKRRNRGRRVTDR
jgi:hypothetical protein